MEQRAALTDGEHLICLVQSDDPRLILAPVGAGRSVGFGGGDAADVAVLESVAVAFEADDFGVVRTRRSLIQ